MQPQPMQREAIASKLEAIAIRSSKAWCVLFQQSYLSSIGKSRSSKPVAIPASANGMVELKKGFFVFQFNNIGVPLILRMRPTQCKKGVCFQQIDNARCHELLVASLLLCQPWMTGRSVSSTSAFPNCSMLQLVKAALKQNQNQ